MAKASPIKIRKHAPYRKSFLIPLWSLQLSLSFTVLILSGISLSTGNSNYYNQAEFLALNVINFLLNLLLTSSVIFVIIKFSHYTLSTKLFKIQSILAVVLSGICTVLYLGMSYWFNAILPGVAWLASISICGRVCVLRNRVKKGEAAEMQRRTQEIDGEGCGEMEFEDGNKFRWVDSEAVGASNGSAGVTVEVREGLKAVKPRPSFNSVASGASGAPPKYIRELV